MSQTLNASPRALREALYVLSTEQDVPDAKLLDDVVRRYPQFGEELTEFAIAIAVDALRGERVVEDAGSGDRSECRQPSCQPRDEPFPKPASCRDGGCG